VSDRKGRLARIRLTLGARTPLTAAGVALVGLAVPAFAGAATPTPASSTICGGSLTKDPSPTADDPNLIDYKIHCNEDITAYTLIVNRRLWDFETIDDFSPTADVIQTDASTSSTESITCEATLPGAGVNCNAGAGGVISAWYTARGTFDLTEPYCKNIPAGSKPGTLATPQALVELIATNATGAENGPFRLNLTSACPTVPDKLPSPLKKKKKQGSKRHSNRAGRAHAKH
jgi:hypothetical protein